jgi:tRNA dimethylallyltransferase
LIRAAEVLEATGRSLAEWQRETRPTLAGGQALTFRTVLLNPPRDELYAACDARFLEMIGKGALEEAKGLLDRALDPTLPGVKALGLPDLLRHLRGEIPLETAVSLAQSATRRYAKRQVTWFSRQFIAGHTIREKFSEHLLEESIPIIIRFFLTERS